MKQLRDNMIKQIKYNKLMMVVLFLITPYILTIMFSIPTADDFSMTLRTDGNYVFESIKAANSMFLSWSGKWPQILLEYLLNPLHYFGEEGYEIGFVLTIFFIIFLIILYRFIKTTLSLLFDETNTKTTQCIYIITLFLILNSGVYSEIFYWFVGNCYLWATMFIMLAFLFYNHIVLDEKSNYLYLVVGGVICFFAGFGIEYDLFIAGMFFLLLKKNDGIKKLRNYIPFLLTVCGGVLSVVAPGNYVRKEAIGNYPNLHEVLMMTIQDYINCNLNFLMRPIILAGIVAIIYLGYCSSKENEINILGLIFLQIVSVVGVLFPVILGRGASSLPNRISFVVNFVIVIFWMLIGFNIGISIKKYYAGEKKLINSFLIVIVILVSCELQLINDGTSRISSLPYVRTISNVYVAYKEKQQANNIFNQIKVSQEEDVVVYIEEEQYYSNIIKPMDISDDSEYWINEAVANYYGKNSVTVMPIQ